MTAGGTSEMSLSGPIMSFNDMLTCFESLNQAQRQMYLTELSKRFRPSDWWHLHTIVSARRRDFLGTIPLELAIQVLEYLTPTEVISCRRVCTGWSHLLVADTVCRALMERWYPYQTERREGNELVGTSWRWMFENTVSRYESIRKLTPRNLWTVQNSYAVDFNSGNERMRDPIFDHHRSFFGQQAAFIDFDTSSGGRSLYVIDLVTDQVLVKNLATPARAVLTGVYLLKDYVMATTRETTKAYVWNIDTLESTIVRLPNTNILSYIADGNLLVAAIQRLDSAILYDAAANSLITIGRGMGSDERKAHVLDARKNQVILITHDSGEIWRAETYHTTSGELLKQEKVTVPKNYAGSFFVNTNLRCGEDFFTVFMYAFNHPSETRLVSNRTIFPHSRATRNGMCTYALIFDRKTGRFLHQRLWFRDLGGIPMELYLYEGTIYTTPLEDQRGIAVALHAPMSTGGADDEIFFPVDITVNERSPFMYAYFCLPMHTVSPGIIVFGGTGRSSAGDPACSCIVCVFKGVHEVEEERAAIAAKEEGESKGREEQEAEAMEE